IILRSLHHITCRNITLLLMTFNPKITTHQLILLNRIILKSLNLVFPDLKLSLYLIL
ncbi:hypothetical protein GLOIN_2v1518174, partial [Rhizophagus irregularis DAOM 181602=DAOM 197198]